MAIKVEKSNGSTLGKYKVIGFPLPIFLILAIITTFAVYLGVLPGGMIGAFASMILLGAVLNEIGNKTPIIKDYLGGGAIVIIFASAALATYGILPEKTVGTMETFMKGGGFLDFYIAALITGSILGMNRRLLVKAAIRYLPAIIGGVVTAIALVAVVGQLIGFGAKEAILFIAIPIMGGGMGAGALPLAQIFSGPFNMEAENVLSIMVPAVAMGNACAIVLGGLLNRLGKAKPSLTGKGELLVEKTEDDNHQEEKFSIDFNLMGMGLLLSTVFFTFGNILGNFIPAVHPYALMIISVAIVKALGIMPRRFEVGASQWFQFVMTYLTGALLVGIGIAYTNLNQIIDAFTWQYIVLVMVTVIGAILGSGFIGKLVGFYPIESAITAGLCMANMGGTGDVAVLSASDRMKLMPFAQISSRIGGAFMLILASLLINLFL
ncbi:2-hydroxycarboxylate transporter family protein [Alkaliphilus peptidifermentans]|uniref:Citrate carrier protein, CCS family n=1 Tax=Alkaliphilus peptidifermentans DSM 18978 TaxID=1120976 RepID=A0A1G5K790_9FIRM|nr:2-hydroxycarboxylate transporter family protein [Alkaliphilus peptidifermentans]SCY96493.1 citrate carrier protein, CCS family [Alkaliphilus peptidifermentans DSM 18978]